MNRLLTAAVLMSSACARQATTPAPVVLYQSVDSSQPISDIDAASFYGVVIAGQRLGEVSVWSNGAHVTDGKGGERVGILEFEILARNESDAPFELDLDATQVVFVGDPKQTITAEYAIAGSRRVAPREVRRIGVRYKLPTANTVERLIGFDLRWSFKSSAGTYTQMTPFRMLQPGQYQLGAEWPQLRYVYYPYEGRKPWNMRWSQVTPDNGNAPVESGQPLPPPQWTQPAEGPNPNG